MRVPRPILLCFALLVFSSAWAQEPATTVESRIINLSTRMRVAPGSSLVTGFVISGTAARPVLVRAVGPGLKDFGVGDLLVNPRLELRAADGTLLASNTGWGNDSGLAAAAAGVGAFPLAAGSMDSAAMLILEPGAYTLNVLANEGQAGTALAEIYDLGEPSADSQLVNASSLSTIPSGADAISGFILAGTTSREFLMRGVGPGLSKFGVSDVLGDPLLTVFDATGRQLASDNNWSGYPQATQGIATTNTTAVAIGAATPANLQNGNGFTPLSPEQNEAKVRFASASTGAFPLEHFSADAAFVMRLSPGAYTVQMKGVPIPSVIPTSAAQGAASSVSTGGTAASAAAAAAAVSSAFVALVPAPTGVALFELYALPVTK